MSEQLIVADYIVKRLAREGITECFGVAGDFAFKLNDAVVRSERIRWIWLVPKRTGRGVCGRWVRTHARLLDADDHVLRSVSCPHSNGVVMGPPRPSGWSCVFHLVGMLDHAQSASRQASSTTRSATGYSRTSRTSPRRRRACRRLSLPTTTRTRD